MIGSLYVEATLTGLYRELMATALVILVSQGLKTFLVSLFILYGARYRTAAARARCQHAPSRAPIAPPAAKNLSVGCESNSG